MPTLELTPDEIGPDRTRLILAYVEAVMLYPDDEAKRREVRNTAAVAAIHEIMNAASAEQLSTAMEDLPSYFKMAGRCHAAY